MTSIVKELLLFFQQPAPAATWLPYPKMRNFVLDVLAEGRRRNLIHLQMEVELTHIREALAAHKAAGGAHVSLTSAIAQGFAAAIDQDRSIQAYRHGRGRLVVFDDVDLAVMVEREIGGARQPLVYIVRSANRKDGVAIQQELQAARTTPLGTTGPLTAIEKQFFSWPRWARKPIWWLIRRDPYLFKDVVGTAGVTSMGMHAAGPAVLIPISPLTLTLSIGAISQRVKLDNNEPVEREVIHLNLSADHDVVDGVPLMRFAGRLRAHLSGAQTGLSREGQ